MVTERESILKVLLPRIEEKKVLIQTIYGEEFDASDVVPASLETGIKMRFDVAGHKDRVLPYDEVLKIVDETSCPSIALYEKKDDFFDEIKKMLGYKMHESEIWMILNLIRKKYPKDL
jgi:hypothetical protein